jgi:hypothetical protein
VVAQTVIIRIVAFTVRARVFLAGTKALIVDGANVRWDYCDTPVFADLDDGETP